MRSTEKMRSSTEDHAFEKSLPFDKYKDKEMLERK
jgi:hypothetical protein